MAASSKPHQWTYDVFVSFRGEDIRKSFVDHLFSDFDQNRIRAFRDDNDLCKGEGISPELYKAIEQSRFLIVIFSKDYASSSWCLRELVKILECKEMAEPKYEVRIIFYDVKPNVVRKQTESYGKAFEKHVVSNKTEVAEWRKALSNAANLSGWDLQDLTNGYEAKFIERISRAVVNKLLDGPLHVGEKLVGVYARVEELNLQRFVGSNKVHMFGICGLSGLGKTTLAKAIYNSMYTYFAGSCFCEDVEGVMQRQGLTQVQMQLIESFMKIGDMKIRTTGEGSMIIKERVASKPIMLVLDNVNHREQVKALAGSPDWFFPGSLIIFTSKDIQLLKSYNVEDIYDMPNLPDHEAYDLFCLHAFGQKHPTDDDFREIVYQVVKHLQGHPLALEVIGGCLREKPVNIWKNELDRLRTYPNAEIQQKLRPSYDGLDFDQKRIFLDIAYSLIGESKDLAANVLDSRNCFAHANIEVLVDKSLIKISHPDKLIQMHELVRIMAREIEREAILPRRLSGQCEEVFREWSENKATEAVEVINICSDSTQKYHISTKAFASMKNLRILKLPRNPNVTFSGRLGYLSNNLRYLCWHGCPFKFLPSDFYPENIVSIDLSYSEIKTLWTTPKSFTRLKILKLSHCQNLINTPDFTHMTDLKELILEGCVSLVEVHPSIGMLKRLQVLSLSGCFWVSHVPEALGRMASLLELYIDRTSIRRLSSVVPSLTKFIRGSSFGQHPWFWSRWTTIPQPSYMPQSLVLSSLASLSLLRKLNLSDCKLLEVPESIRGLSCLEELDLSGNSFVSLPEGLKQLSRLDTLSLDGCKKLELLPELPPMITRLSASNCDMLQVAENTELEGLSCLGGLCLDGNNFTRLPESLRQLSCLFYLSLNGCKKLEALPELPASIGSLHASGCPKLFRKHTIETQEPQVAFQPSDTCITSQDKLSSLLRHMDFQMINLPDRFNMVLEGNRIPEWFPYQSLGGDVKVELPPEFCFHEFSGFAVCVAFRFKKPDCAFHCDVEMNGCTYGSNYGFSVHCIDELDKIYLYYDTTIWKWKEVKAAKHVTLSIKGRDVEVKKFGVRLLCDESGLKYETLLPSNNNNTSDAWL